MVSSSSTSMMTFRTHVFEGTDHYGCSAHWDSDAVCLVFAKLSTKGVGLAFFMHSGEYQSLCKKKKKPRPAREAPLTAFAKEKTFSHMSRKFPNHTS